jgi:hypothetical protein
VALVLAVVGFFLLLVPVPYYAVRRRSLSGPLLHVTTSEHARAIVADVPDGWVRVRPGPRRMHRLPLLGWPLRPFGERVYFYLGDAWPRRFRRRYNLAHPEECTHAVVVDVADSPRSVSGVASTGAGSTPRWRGRGSTGVPAGSSSAPNRPWRYPGRLGDGEPGRWSPPGEPQTRVRGRRWRRFPAPVRQA